jgi:hypothetical protein
MQLPPKETVLYEIGRRRLRKLTETENPTSHIYSVPRILQFCDLFHNLLKARFLNWLSLEEC